MHISCVRGSPLIRTVLVLLALVVSGIGFARLTDRKADPVVVTDPAARADGSGKMIPALARITLSEIPGSIALKSGEQLVDLKHDGSGVFTGKLEIDPANPILFLEVACVSPKVGVLGGSNFAKLVIEADGEETFTHVFDAPGDIDDFVELPF